MKCRVSLFPKCKPVQFSSRRYNTVQYSSRRYNTVQYSNVQHSAEYSTIDISRRGECTFVKYFTKPDNVFAVRCRQFGCYCNWGFTLSWCDPWPGYYYLQSGAILLTDSDQNIVIKRCGMVQFRARMRPFNGSGEERNPGPVLLPAILHILIVQVNCAGKVKCCTRDEGRNFKSTSKKKSLR